MCGSNILEVLFYLDINKSPELNSMLIGMRILTDISVFFLKKKYKKRKVCIFTEKSISEMETATFYKICMNFLYIILIL